MAVPSRVRIAYESVESAALAIAAQLDQTVGAFAARNGYMFTGPRLKTLSSLSEKLESGRFTNWSDVDDLVACSVVVPTSRHERSVIAFLDMVYEQRELRLRNTVQKPPDVFRFDATRYVGRLRAESVSDLPSGSDGISFEVQIPTIFEHAWQVVMHDLVYKSHDVDWRKLRLGAQLKAAVEQLDWIIASFQSSAEAVSLSYHPETELRNRIVLLCKGLIDAGLLASELEPESWSRFADNTLALVLSYSNRYRLENDVAMLMSAVVRRLIDSESPGSVSGSLFQLLLGEVHRKPTKEASLDRFVIVDSEELRTFHGVDVIPKPFAFDS
jgi:ppGpp synthetase/RelA/SpoT-type nucleotidyltranferase